MRKPSTQIELETTAVCGITPEKLARQLRGDLDAIALKALAKQPNERYPSAAAFAEDLRRYLEGKPIQALPARLTDRLGKFVRRNKAIVGASTMAIAAILVAIGYSLHREAVYQVKVAANAVAAVPVAIPEKSIAVLPFVNMSSDKEQDYFSDGLSEELIDLLTRVPNMRVPARTSSFYFKGKQVTVAEIAKTLNVAHVLEGSVRKAGNTIRVTAHSSALTTAITLVRDVRSRTQGHLQMQDEIAAAVVIALQAKLASTPHAVAHRTESMEAYNQYLLGRQLIYRGGLDEGRRAVDAYRKAITLDPGYAAAYAGLVIAEFDVANLSSVGCCARQGRAAREAAEKAVALAPDLGEAYAARGWVNMWYGFDFGRAQADIEKAISLNPEDSVVRHLYAFLLATLGRLPEAIAAEREAIQSDPLAADYWARLGYFFQANGQFDDAHQALERALEINPRSPLAHHSLWLLLWQEGRTREALTEARHLEFELFRDCGVASAESTLGHAKESQRALDALLAKHAQDGAYQIVEVYATLGETKRAFEWLERAYEQHDAGLAYIKFDPLLKPLRSDPRYHAMLHKMNLPD